VKVAISLPAIDATRKIRAKVEKIFNPAK